VRRKTICSLQKTGPFKVWIWRIQSDTQRCHYVSESMGQSTIHEGSQRTGACRLVQHARLTEVCYRLYTIFSGS
jgi:hypothetical protein